jgi:hypothetical protein
MNNIPVGIVIRILRIALGYGSRTERITRLLNSTDAGVAITSRSLWASGYLKQDEGTVIVDPQ